MTKSTQNIKFYKKPIITFVGAGGKSSIISKLSQKLLTNHNTILIMTTTNMFYSNKIKIKYTLIHTNKNFFYYKQKKSIITGIQYHNKKTNKITGFIKKNLFPNKISRKLDYILIEADGSKLKPIKAPCRHEPVIPKQSKIIIGVIGLDSFNKPINNKTVHRHKKLLSLITKKSNNNKFINKKNILTLIKSKRGLFKNTTNHMIKIIILNKADHNKITQKGKKLGHAIIKKHNYIKYTLITSLKNLKNPVKTVIKNKIIT